MSKALRRHHRARLKNKRRNYNSNLTCEGLNLGRAIRLVNTATPCSCWMCGNPRKHLGNRKSAKTLQELSDLEALKKYHD